MKRGLTMRMMAFCMGMLLVTATGYAKEMMVSVKGQDHKINITSMKREITPQDRQAGSQTSALGCSLLFYSHLAANDIEKASQLSTDPKSVLDMWTQYRERLGADEFKKFMDEYFTAKNVIVAEIVKGTTHMLVVQPPDEKAAAQLYLNRDGTFMLLGTPTMDDAKVLLKVLTMIQDGTLKPE